MADEWVTLRHRDHGGEQQFAPESVDAWRALGWLPVDEAPDPPTADEAATEAPPRRTKKEA